MSNVFTPMRGNPNIPYPQVTSESDNHLTFSTEKKNAIFADIMSRDINTIHQVVRKYINGEIENLRFY